MRHRPRRPRAPRIEELEARILHSADLALGLGFAPGDAGAPLTAPLAHAAHPLASLRELAVVDGAAERSGWLARVLHARAREGAAVELLALDARRDGLDTLGRTLAERRDIGTLHLSLPVLDQALRVGRDTLGIDALDRRAAEVAGWGRALRQGAQLAWHGAQAGELPASIAQLTGAQLIDGAALLADAPRTPLRELVFVDAGADPTGELAARWREAAAERGAGIEVVVLDAGTDGIAQIGRWLAGAEGVQAVHILSHGTAGQIQLGSVVLDRGTLAQRAVEIQGWRAALTEDADLLIYGCDVAAADSGAQFVAHLAALTGADVAASDDPTGAAELGGDWNLEVQAGTVQTQALWQGLAPAGWQGLLAIYTVTSTADTGAAGTLRWAISQANANAGADTINFNIAVNDPNHLYYRDNGATGTLSAPVATTLADGAIADFDADYLAGTARSWWRITLGTTPLDITEAVIIDGSSQPGHSASKGPVIEINAAAVTGTDQNAIALTAGASTVRGLVINRAGDDGIEVDTGASGSVIVGNYIGTDVSGTLGASGGYGVGRGISVKANNVTIGGSNPADRNVVSATTLTSEPTSNHAIAFYSNASNGVVQGNYIGTKADGTGNLGNARTGINVLGGAANIKIGGTNPGEGNIIANSGDGGAWIRSTAGIGNAVIGNTIYNNTGLGIDLGANASTANDSGDGDSATAANGLQNFPVLFVASSTAGNTTISGALNSTASTTFRIEFFSNATGDASGFGEGQTYLGFTTVTTDAAGNASFNATLAGVAVASGSAVSATATVDLGGGIYRSTSEFAANLTVNISAQVGAGQDSYIRLNNPTLNYGTSTSLVIDRETTDLQRALLQFDLSAIPANAIVTSATLQMQSTQIGGTLNINVYELLRSWTEGSGSGTVDAANWTQAASGTNWTSAGGDFNAAAAATLNTSTTGQHAWDLTSLVQAWVNGSKANNGVMIASPDGGGNRTATYDSSEGTTPPRLVINYTVPIPPVISMPGPQLTRGDAAVVLSGASAISVSDADSGVLQLNLSASGGSISLSATAGLTFTVGDGSGDATMTFSGTTAALNTALNGLVFTPTPGFSGQASLEVAASDSLQTTVGQTSIGPTVSAQYDKQQIGTRITLGSAGTVTSLSVYMQNLKLNPGVDLGLYTDVAGEPGVLLTQVSRDLAAGSGWYTFDVPDVAVSAGNYWIGIAPEKEGRFYYGSTGGSSRISNYDPALGLASTWTGTTSSNAWSISAFATVTPTGQSAAGDLETLAITVQSAPALDGTRSPALVAQNEDSGVPSGAVGTLVSALVDFASPAGQVDNVTDVDAGAELGIAVTGADATNGSWWYSTDNGSTWGLLGPVSNASARLLAADGGTRLYFQANANWNGTLASAITFRAWDRSDALPNGSSGVNTAAGGGTSAFSAATDTASLTVNAVNDAPVLDNTGTMALPNAVQYDTNPAGMTVAALIASAGGNRITDIDAGATEGIAITAADNSNGTWQYSINSGGTWADIGAVTGSSARVLADTGNTRVRFVPGGAFTGGATISFRAWDGSDAIANGTAGVDASAGGGSSAFSNATQVATIFVEPIQVLLWMSTAGDVTGSGVPGVPNWTQSTVLSLGDPGLALGAGVTGGTVRTVTDFDNFGTDVDLTGLHRINQAVTLTGPGIVGGSLGLQQGDLLFVTPAAETLSTGAASPPAGWATSIGTNAGSIYVFRPDVANNYGSGYFRQVMAGPGVNTTREIVVVETAITVGETTLAAGDLLFTQEGNLQQNNVYWYRTATNTTSLLVNGSDVGIPSGGTGAGIDSLELVQGSFTAGGQNFQAGDLLVGFNKQVNNLGSGGSTITVEMQDVARLRLTATTFGSGSAVSASTAIVFDGAANARFDTANENVDAISLLVQGAGSNVAPVVALPGAALAYAEGAGAVIVAASATVSDADSPNLDTGVLRVDLTGNPSIDDRLWVRNEGSGAGQIGVAGSNVTYGGVVIGTVAGGNDGYTPLVVTFNANATPAAAQALLRNVTFENVSNNPSAAPRTLRVLLSDGDNATSLAVTKTINVTNVNDAPVATNDAYVTDEDTPLVVAPPTTNLSNAWGFNEGSGQTVASGGSLGSGGTLGSTGGADAADPTWTTGVVGGGLSFDGAGDYVATTSTDLKTASSFTLSTWFKTNSTTTTQHLLWQGYAGGNGYGNGGSTTPDTSEMSLSVGSYTAAYNNRIVFSLGYDVPANGADSIFIVSASDFTDTSRWHHVAVTVTDIGGGVMRASLYVDGKLEGTDTGSQTDRSVWEPLRIGAAGNGSRSFNGQIDEVRIYANELSGAQVQSIAQGGVLANDSDIDGPRLQVNTAVVTGPANGTLSINQDGSFTYTPNANFFGVDSFTYRANDGTADSNVATVTITVNPVNDAPSFGVGNGAVTTAFGTGTGIAYAVAVQADGKIVTAGSARVGATDDFAVARYLADGTLDLSFGSGGMVTTAIGPGADWAHGVVVQVDGKIVVAGRSHNGSNYDVAVVRYNADGTLDTSFGAGTGMVTVDFGSGDDVGNMLALQADGRIVVSARARIGATEDFAVLRFNADGTLDTSFNGTGRVTTAIGAGNERGQRMTIQPDGKIVVSGFSHNGANNDFAVARYNTDGTLDLSFGGTGIVTTAIGSGDDLGGGVAVQADGKIVVGGTSRIGATDDFALVRYNADGTLDTSFGVGGVVTTDIGAGNDSGHGLRLQADGNIVVGGLATMGGSSDFAVVRYNSDGSLDASFGSGGKTTVAVSAGTDYALEMALQSDGSVLLAGRSHNGTNDDFALVGVDSSGNVDTRFGTGLLNGQPVFVEGGAAVVLDRDAQVVDAELSAADNFGGATLTLARNGAAAPQDVFSATGTLSFVGGNVVLSGTTIGTYTNGAGTLQLSFNGNATGARVNQALQQIAYANSSDAPPATVRIDWTFSDGNSGAQGSGGALQASGYTTVSVASTNDAPVLDATRSPMLAAQNEDAGAPVGAVGTQVSALLDFASPAGQVDNVTDGDTNPGLGIAVTAADTTNGSWWFSLDDGANWQALGAVSDGAARLLSTDAGTRLVFQSNANWNGTLSNAITFRAWDRSDGLSSGSPGVDTTTSGGTRAFSATTDTTSLTVNPLNDAPLLSYAGGSASIPENYGPLVLAASASVSDIDSANFDGGQLVTTVTANGLAEDRLTVRHQGNGVGQVGVSGTDISVGGVLVGSFNGPVTGGTSLVITFNANADAAAVQAVARNVTYQNTSESPSALVRTIEGYVTDGDGGTSNLGSGTIAVTAVNDAPSIDNGAAVPLAGTDRLTPSAGTTVASILTSANWADVDATPQRGIAITGVTGAGSWEYSTDGVTWRAVGAVAANNALLLADTSQIRYQPDGLTAETATLSFKAWDRVSGSASTNAVPSYANPGAGGGSTAYSGSTAGASLVVTPVNFAPVIATTAGAMSTDENIISAVDPSLTVTDVDSVVLNGATVSITTGFVAGQDRLVFVDQFGISGSYNAATGVLTLSGAASVADYQAALRAVAYQNTSDTPNTATRTVSFVVNDGLVDSVPAQRDITVIARNDAPVVGDRWLGFDGNDMVRVPNSASLTMTGTVTIEAWVMRQGTPTSDQLIVNKEGEYELGISVSGEVQWAFASAAPGWTWVDTGYVLPADRWTHLAVSYDNGVVKTYVNGVEVHSYRGSGTIGDAHPAFNDLTIGGRGNVATQRFEGRIDEVRVWSTARSAAEVAAAFDQTLAGIEAGLVGYWRFAESGGGTAIDSSTQGNDGVLGAGVPAEAPTRPVAYTVAEDTPLTSAAPGVLGWASDADGDPLTAVLVSGPAQAAAFALNGDGSFTYTPNANFNGVDSFTYRANDGTADSNLATVTITVTPVNDAPTTSPVTLVAIAEDSVARLITQAELLANASDVDGPGLTATGLAIASGTGSLVDNGDGTWTYTPALNDDAAVSFSYTVTDGGLSAAGTASLDITPVNDAPTTSPVTLVAMAEDGGPRLITQAELLANAADVDGPGLTAIGLAISAGSGSLVDNGNGTWTYTPALNDDTAVSFSYTVTDGSLTAAGTASLDITPVNDAPTNGPVTLASIAEDSGGRLITQAELLANAADVDGPGLTATGLAISTGSGSLVDNGNGTWTYTPALNDDTAVSFSYTVTDGSLTAAGSASLDLTPVNDAPTTGAVTLAPIGEDSVGRLITQAELLANAADVDGPGLTATGLAISAGSGSLVDNGNGTWTYTPALNDDTAVSFSYTVTDGSLSSAGTASVDITPVNDAPVVAPSGGAAAYFENAAPMAVDAALTVGDVDSATLAGATIRIALNHQSGQDVLSFTDQLGITGSWDAMSGTLTLTGVSSVANYQAALRSVAYHNTSEAPSTLARSVEFVVSDGSLNSLAAARSLSVGSINDAPATDDASAIGNEDSAAIAITLTGSDVDGSVQSFRLSSLPAHGTLYSDAGLSIVVAAGIDIAASANAATLYFVPNANWEGVTTFQYAARDDFPTSDPSPATATITVTAQNDAPTVANPIVDQGVAEDAAYSFPFAANTFGDVDLGDSLTYTASGLPSWLSFDAATRTFSGTPSNADVGVTTITVRATDGAGSFVEDVFDVTVTNVNDAPVVTTTAGSLNVNENAPATAIDATLALSDLDSATLAGATVRISAAYANGQDVLGFTNQLGITGSWDAGTGTLTLSGVASVADYETALRSVTYRNTSEDPSIAVRTVEFIVNDGALDSAPATRQVQVVSVNDAPQTSDASANGQEDGAIAVVLSATDVDGTVAHFRLSNLPANGTLFTDAGLTAPAAALTDLVATGGTLTLYFRPDADWSGSTSFGFTAFDDQGAPDLSSSLATITVQSVNDAPTGAGRTVTILEDTLHTFSAADFGFADANDTPAGSLLAVRIATLPAAGNLTLGGAAVVAGQTVAVADIHAGLLRFLPAAHANGAGHAGFTFQVQDDGGTASGGIDLDPTPDTITIDVTPINDAPTGAPVVTGTPTEDQTLGIDTSALADADGLGSFGVQWQRDGVDVVGATGPTYVLGDADVGARIRVVVSYTDGGGTLETLFSAVTAPVANVNDAAAGAPAILGTPTEDQVLSADLSAITDADGLGSMALQWLRDGVAVAGATGVSYTLGDADVGTRISLRASYTDGRGSAESVTSAPTPAIANVNDAPVVLVPLPALSATEDQGFAFDLPAGTFGDIDPGDTLRISAAGLPAWLAFDAASGRFSGTPGNGDVGRVTIVVTATDDAGATAQATLDVDVLGVNDEEQLAVNAGLVVDEGGQVRIDAAYLAATDVDNTAAELVFTLVTAPGRGSLLLDGIALADGGRFTQADIDAGRLAYRHDGSETVGDGFDLVLDDGSGGTTSLRVGVLVHPVNDHAPQITGPAVFERLENGHAITRLAATDADLPAAALTWQIAGGADAARFEIDAASGELRFAAAPDHEAPADDDRDNVYEVRVEAGDGQFTGSRMLRVSVLDDNEPFALQAGSANLDEDLAATGDARLLAADPEQAALAFTLAQAPAHGTLDVNADGTWRYAPQADWHGDDTFVLRVDDGRHSGDLHMAVRVAAVDDAPTLRIVSASVSAVPGLTLALDEQVLQLQDIDTPQAQLGVEVGAVRGGWFERVAQPGVAITEFTRSELAQGAIAFRVLGYEAPQFELRGVGGSQVSGWVSGGITLLAGSPDPVAGADPFAEPPLVPTGGWSEWPVTTVGGTSTTPSVAAGSSASAAADRTPRSPQGAAEPPAGVGAGAFEPAALTEPRTVETGAVRTSVQAALLRRLGVQAVALGWPGSINTVLPEFQQWFEALAGLKVAGGSSGIAGVAGTQDLAEADSSTQFQAELSGAELSGLAAAVLLMSWAVRAGGIVGSLAITSPAWRMVDPLPILGGDDDDEAVEPPDADRQGEDLAAEVLARSARR